jgi:hypothetical protein
MTTNARVSPDAPLSHARGLGSIEIPHIRRLLADKISHEHVTDLGRVLDATMADVLSLESTQNVNISLAEIIL